jgi:GntR family transcriptional regulator
MVEPAYAVLAARLRTRITGGELKPGDLLPSEAALMHAEGVSRHTVRSAFAMLIGEGLVVSRNGLGHMVRESTSLVWYASEPERNDGKGGVVPSDTWSRSIMRQGHMPSEQITTQIALADERVAGLLDLPVDEPVVIRRRLRLVDGRPSSLADSYYPRSIVAGTRIELPGDIVPGVYAVFANELGRPWALTLDRITARAPTRHESEVLDLARGVAVAEVARRSFDPAGVPVRVTLFILPGDRLELEYRHRKAAA